VAFAAEQGKHQTNAAGARRHGAADLPQWVTVERCAELLPARARNWIHLRPFAQLNQVERLAKKPREASESMNWNPSAGAKPSIGPSLMIPAAPSCKGCGRLR